MLSTPPLARPALSGSASFEPSSTRVLVFSDASDTDHPVLHPGRVVRLRIHRPDHRALPPHYIHFLLASPWLIHHSHPLPSFHFRPLLLQRYALLPSSSTRPGILSPRSAFPPRSVACGPSAFRGRARCYCYVLPGPGSPRNPRSSRAGTRARHLRFPHTAIAIILGPKLIPALVNSRPSPSQIDALAVRIHRFSNPPALCSLSRIPVLATSNPRASRPVSKSQASSNASKPKSLRLQMHVQCLRSQKRIHALTIDGRLESRIQGAQLPKRASASPKPLAPRSRIHRISNPHALRSQLRIPAVLKTTPTRMPSISYKHERS
ncbi:hypothetical protein DFH09DRAFT_1103072 [Mycena vulgaris]|nr:hypothetical protein DFH09DRAFT_1103072 [Mycena vulgaris]